jgi:hypothetical protein
MREEKKGKERRGNRGHITNSLFTHQILLKKSRRDNSTHTIKDHQMMF